MASYPKNVKRNATRPHVDRRGKTGSMVQTNDNRERKERELMEKLTSWNQLK